MTLPEGFSYFDPFLTPDEQRASLQMIQELRFTHDRFRGRQLKRSYSQFGFAYASTGRKLNPAPAFPSFLSEIAEKALPHCTPGTRFDQCIITHYPRDAGIGWHTDASHFDDCIIAASLGDVAWLQFRPNTSPNTSKDVSAEINVLPGTLYVMTGPARRDYQHRVVPVKGDRYSLTFRLVKNNSLVAVTT